MTAKCASCATYLTRASLPLIRREVSLRSAPRVPRAASRGGGTMATSVFPQGAQLWDRIVTVYKQAGEKGAAYQMDTQPRTLHDGGVDFVVRVATSLQDKPKAPKSGDTKNVNPFLPYEEDLWVAHLSESHTMLLNKYNVVDHHALVVTRAFESQEDPLNARDLDAVLRAVSCYPTGALAYYNCGPVSGRSQPHKHLQVVPLPMAVGGSPDHEPPIATRVVAAMGAGREGEVTEVRTLPFQAFAVLLGNGDLTGAKLQSHCDALLERCEAASRAAGLPKPSYNVVLARNAAHTFVMMVPRSQETHGPLSINSLGFAGTMLVRTTEELDFLQREGCMEVLRSVGIPW